MLKAVAKVRDEVLKQCGGVNKVNLEVITRVFSGVTALDVIVFVRYEAPPENPIWGEFARWNRQPGVYQSFETIVEVRYAAHLLGPGKEDWRRFVICKELCHSLEAAQGSHDVSKAAMENLVDCFSLMSAGKYENLPRAAHIEILAEAGALELLCPLATRREILKANAGQLDDAALADIAREFNTPLEYIKTAFLPDQMQAIEWLLENDH